MKARVVFVEGLPGSGKITASKTVYDLLTEEGIDAELWYENSLDHPADFDGTAYWDEEAFQALRKSSPDPELLHALVQKDVYERDPDLHMRIMQKRWQDFVRRHRMMGRCSSSNASCFRILSLH